MDTVTSRPSPKVVGGASSHHDIEWCGYFQMPLHYPRYTQADYEAMPEWRVDCLLKEYGLPIIGGVEDKRKFAMGAFLWIKLTKRSTTPTPFFLVFVKRYGKLQTGIIST
ncbi:hypothetical protein CR513_61047, partial [Mucuna pruriens]